MDPITHNLLFPVSPAGQSTDPIPTDQYDPALATFEQMVDNIVLKEQKNAPLVEQAAIQKAKQQALYAEKIAFLTGAVHQAETALAGVESPTPPTVQIPQGPQAPPPLVPQTEKAYQESQVAYWKAKLAQAGIPDGTTGLQ